MTSITTSTQRQSTHKQTSPNHKDHAPANIAFNVVLIWPFTIPSTHHEAVSRILKNLARFALLYGLFVWVVLAITLIPARKISLLLLSVMGNFTLLYVLLLRMMPDSVVLHRLIDKRLVAAVVVVVTTVLMVVTDAWIHLVIVVLSSIPVVFIHAVLVGKDVTGWFCGIQSGSGEGEDHALLIVDDKSELDSV